MDEISSSLMAALQVSDNDSSDANEALDSLWRQVLFANAGLKIINDIYAFYANNEIILDDVLRAKTREAFWSVLNLLNPPIVYVDQQLLLLQNGIVIGEEYLEKDGTPKISKSREAASEDLKTIFETSRQYLQRYKQYIGGFEWS